MSRSVLKTGLFASFAAAPLLFSSAFAFAEEAATPAATAPAARVSATAAPDPSPAISQTPPEVLPPAAAPAPTHFGDAGQFALSFNEEFPVNVDDVIAGNQLQASVFVAPHLSVGLLVGAQWLSSSPTNGASQKQFIFRIGPRVGYDFAISDYVSIWPQIGIDYRRDEEDLSEPAGVSYSPDGSTTLAIGFTAIAPVLIHPAKGFFVGAGPAFYTEFSNNTSSGSNSTDNNKVTSVGLMATIGGAI